MNKQTKELDCMGFFAVPENDPVFLGMLDSNKLELLMVDCTTVVTNYRKGQINE